MNFYSYSAFTVLMQTQAAYLGTDSENYIAEDEQQMDTTIASADNAWENICRLRSAIDAQTISECITLLVARPGCGVPDCGAGVAVGDDNYTGDEFDMVCDSGQKG